MRALGENRGHHHDAADRGRRVGRRASWRAASALPLLAVLAHRHGREPLDDPHVPPGDRPRPDRACSLVLPRLGRRVVRARSTSRAWRAHARASSGPRSIPTETTRVAEFNDIDSVAVGLEHGDVACLLMEPALTNIGIVLPEPGFLGEVRDAVRRARDAPDHRRDAHAQRRPGRLHGGVGARPDAVTLGKSIGGGVPIGAYGVTAELAERIAVAGGRRLRGHGRRGRHARRQRAVAGGRARHAGRGAHRRGVRGTWSRCASASWPARRRRSPITGCRGRSSRSAPAASTASRPSRRRTGAESAAAGDPDAR